MSDFEQRWRQRRACWVSRRQMCDPRVLEATSISHTIAKGFVLEHHYSGSYPSVRCRVGIFERGHLVGVATFGIPAGPRVLEAWTGFGQDEAIELNRFVLLDEVGYNAESRALKLARRVLLEQLPDLKALLAFSDPVLRTSLGGEVTLPGHVGTIYQATNAAYRGRTGSRRLVLDAQGRVLSPRLIQKIRQRQSGHVYATQKLIDSGAPPPREGEAPDAWLKRALGLFRRIHHPGNHGYVWPLRPRHEIVSCAAYPKVPDPVQLGLL